MEVDNLLNLMQPDLEKLKHRAFQRHYEKGSQIFGEGDIAGELYVIESGRVSVVIQEFSHQENVSSLGPGDYFGEMAFLLGDKRSATIVALEKTTLHCLDRNSFLALYESDMDLAAKFDAILTRRNQELTRKETLIEHPGMKGNRCHIGIKGDPSLRESAFTRERYESVADKCLTSLQVQLYDLLLNRCAYEVSIHFNSGEVHVRTVFDPLNEKIHPADKLANKGFVERHFPLMNYEQKGEMVKRLYAFLASDPGLDCLQHQTQEMMCAGFAAWEPVSPASIARILAKLPMLRQIQNFYIRNFTVSTLKDTVRMQFNCDGAHIVDIEQFEAFLEENIPVDSEGYEGDSDRRQSERRWQKPEAPDGSIVFDRRNPPGRRQEDWDEHIRLMSSRS